MTLVRPSTYEDVEYIEKHMRVEDVEECYAGGVRPYNALYTGVCISDVCHTLIDPKTGNPGAMLGINPTAYTGVGNIWLLGTPAIEQNAITFLRHSKPWLAEQEKACGYDALFNYTHVNNRVHHRWLKWLGFVFLRKIELTHNNSFYEFVKLGG